MPAEPAESVVREKPCPIVAVIGVSSGGSHRCHQSALRKEALGQPKFHQAVAPSCEAGGRLIGSCSEDLEWRICRSGPARQARQARQAAESVLKYEAGCGVGLKIRIRQGRVANVAIFNPTGLFT
jgi:hypothetical protein